MIETAALIPGTEVPVGDGYTKAMRCAIATRTGRVAAVIKRIPRQAVLAEAFSAVLLRAWGLNVPTPYLVTEGEALSFASADDAYPSLKQRMGLVGMPQEHPAYTPMLEVASKIAASFEQTPLAMLADEAIDNRDRNLGNILWDGNEVAWIDHELALGLAHNLADTNKLAAMVLAHGDANACQQSAIGKWMSMNRDAPQQACQECGPDTAGMAALVAQRLNTLGGRIIGRFPAPKDLLSAP